MSRIEQCFGQLKADGRKALVVYLVAGDPEPAVTVPLMHAMVAAGANIIELGLPFSDPEAEGPVIQLAHERALKHNVSLRDTLAMARTFRETDQTTPIVLMGYINPIEAMGYDVFGQLAGDAGIDGTILVNVPPEEGELLDQSLAANKIDPVYLLSPTTTDARARKLCEKTRGFAYYVSLKGTTGASTLDVDSVRDRMSTFREFARTPIVVGFGIKDGESAASIAAVSDGAVVGSALVSLMAEHADDKPRMMQAVQHLIGEMRTAMDAEAV